MRLHVEHVVRFVFSFFWLLLFCKFLSRMGNDIRRRFLASSAFTNLKIHALICCSDHTHTHYTHRTSQCLLFFLLDFFIQFENSSFSLFGFVLGLNHSSSSTNWLWHLNEQCKHLKRNCAHDTANYNLQKCMLCFCCCSIFGYVTYVKFSCVVYGHLFDQTKMHFNTKDLFQIFPQVNLSSIYFFVYRDPS